MRFDPWARKIPWRRKWQSTPVFLPGKFHGQRSLAGYSLWGCKESDATEHTSWSRMGPHSVWLVSLDKETNKCKGKCHEKVEAEDFLDGPVLKNPPANAGDTGFTPCRGRCHMLQGNKPACHNYQACALQGQCSAPWEAHALEKARVQPQRPSTAKNKKVNKILKKWRWRQRPDWCSYKPRTAGDTRSCTRQGRKLLFGFLKECNSANFLILDFSLPELWETNSCFKSLSFQSFVSAALRNQYQCKGARHTEDEGRESQGCRNSICNVSKEAETSANARNQDKA